MRGREVGARVGRAPHAFVVVEAGDGVAFGGRVGRIGSAGGEGEGDRGSV